MHTGLRVQNPIFLSNFKETWICETDFRVSSIIQLSRKSVQREPSCMRTDRHMTKPIIALRNFANAPLKQLCCVELLPSYTPGWETLFWVPASLFQHRNYPDAFPSIWWKYRQVHNFRLLNTFRGHTEQVGVLRQIDLSVSFIFGLHR